MAQDITETTKYLVAERQVFSRSLLWDLQQHYFAQRGVEAWRQGEVPHYVTSNPTVANSYAEIVFAFWRDQQRLAPAGEDYDEPLYLCELGAGSGRFAFHFLSRLTSLCEQADLSPTAFRYVLTDLAESNLDFWHGHPRFQDFFDSGLLDIALFDVNHSTQLSLKLSGQTIDAASLDRPFVVIANYVFDSTPQELFYLDNQRCHQCLVSLFADEDPKTLPVAEALAHLRYKYDYQPLADAPYQEPYLQHLLADYQRALSDTHLLFPAAGLRCLQRLRALSKQGVFLLSADKGEHSLSALQGAPPPTLVCHGSFSLPVNYHAFKVHCEQSGGLALFPDYHSDNLNVSSLLFLSEAASYTETRRAYQRHVQEFSPDDFYVITKHVQQYISEMSANDILAYLRLSFYDSHQFARYLPRLMELAPGLSLTERQALSDAVAKVWDLYFPLGEELDLAYHIACLFYEMEDYPRALAYFESSTEIYGQHTGTLYNMAVCYQLLGQDEQAESLLREVLKHDPDNQPAGALLADYESRNEGRSESKA